MPERTTGNKKFLLVDVERDDDGGSNGAPKEKEAMEEEEDGCLDWITFA